VSFRGEDASFVVVIPGRAEHEPGISRHNEIPGSLAFASARNDKKRI
jgi:hypothetical protein